MPYRKLPIIDKQYAITVCKIGQGRKECRFVFHDLDNDIRRCLKVDKEYETKINLKVREYISANQADDDWTAPIGTNCKGYDKVVVGDYMSRWSDPDPYEENNMVHIDKYMEPVDIPPKINHKFSNKQGQTKKEREMVKNHDHFENERRINQFESVDLDAVVIKCLRESIDHANLMVMTQANDLKSNQKIGLFVTSLRSKIINKGLPFTLQTFLVEVLCDPNKWDDIGLLHTGFNHGYGYLFSLSFNDHYEFSNGKKRQVQIDSHRILEWLEVTKMGHIYKDDKEIQNEIGADLTKINYDLDQMSFYLNEADRLDEQSQQVLGQLADTFEELEGSQK